ncbi:MAG: TetR/AcrR family transcriptional regulator [Comamonas sp.]
MKVSKSQAAEHRAGIVESAARLYREKGLSGVGVAEITRDAGLTHGGLYRHFESKDALAREACLRAFEWTIIPLDGLELDSDAPSTTKLQAMVDSYLSASHRDHPGEGCPAAALATDAARAGPEMSEVFAQGVERNIQRFMRVLEGEPVEKRAQTMVLLSSMVGALALARATAAGNPALSEEILRTLRERLVPGARD